MPTGTTVPLERRRQLYKVAQEWNLIIIEDDAYYYLQYPNGAGQWLPASLSLPPPPQTPTKFPSLQHASVLNGASLHS